MSGHTSFDALRLGKQLQQTSAALQEIAEMHLAERDHAVHVLCRECSRVWPCDTYRAATDHSEGN